MTDFVPSPIQDFMPIPVDEGGLFTPASAAAIDLAVSLVNKCVELAELKDADFTAKMDDLTNATTGFLVAHEAADVTAGSITVTAPTEPPMTVSDTSTALVFGHFESEAATIIADQAAKFTAFMSTWFPDTAATYEAAEDYILAAITNTTSGIVPAAIKTAILEDARASALAEANRATENLNAGMSAKRHRFPPGQATALAREIAQQALDNIAAASRAIAIKDFELSHQTALQAVQMALSARQSALAAATQYIAGIVAQGWQGGAQITGAAHGAEVAKLQAAYQAYAGRTNAAELALRATQADVTLAFEAAKLNQSKDLQEVENYLKAFLAQAQLIGHQLVGMLNNLRAGSSLTMGVNAS